jgi:hypothetical protein
MALTIPVEEISAEARQVDVRKALFAAARLLWTLVLAVPYALGWTLRKVWLGLVMLRTALVIGWREAGRTSTAKDGEDG